MPLCVLSLRLPFLGGGGGGCASELRAPLPGLRQLFLVKLFAPPNFCFVPFFAHGKTTPPPSCPAHNLGVQGGGLGDVGGGGRGGGGSGEPRALGAVSEREGRGAPEEEGGGGGAGGAAQSSGGAVAGERGGEHGGGGGAFAGVEGGAECFLLFCLFVCVCVSVRPAGNVGGSVFVRVEKIQQAGVGGTD